MVPFRISRLFGLRVTVDGMLLVNAQGLKLVFKEPKRDDTLRDQQIEQVELTWADLKQVVCDFGMLNDEVVLEVNPSANVVRLPGVSEDRVSLSVRKQHREELKELEKRIDEYRRGTRRDDVDDLLDDVRDFLHGG
ncbi:MAG: hypothetical protein KDA92_05960 [Planctomycetales bacterium]|nr:hypothetical protein [Planctomycetales bacterium]